MKQTKGDVKMKKSELAEKVFQLNAQSREIDKELKALKEQLKKAGPGKYGDYVVAINEQERESFKLKDAKSKVTATVWNKIKDFVTVSAYQVVKVSKA